MAKIDEPAVARNTPSMPQAPNDAGSVTNNDLLRAFQAQRNDARDAEAIAQAKLIAASRVIADLRLQIEAVAQEEASSPETEGARKAPKAATK